MGWKAIEENVDKEVDREKLYYLVCIFSVLLLVTPSFLILIAKVALNKGQDVSDSYTTTATTPMLTTETPEACPSNELGYNFMMIYMENNITSLIHILEVYPTPRYSSRINVSISWPNSILLNTTNHIDFTISPPDVKVIEIPNNLQMSGLEQAMKGISVKASDKIGVYGMNRHEATCDGFMALPNHLLGTEHYVVCFYPEDKQNQVAFVATQDDTTVVLSLRNKTRPSISIIWNGTYNRSGSNMTFRLVRGEAVHIKADADLTGCGVFSDKPIAVFAGNDLTRVGDKLFSGVDVNFTWAMNHLVEQMPDISHWGSSFYLVPFLFKFNQTNPSPGYQVKVVCSEDNTTTIVYSPSGLNTSFFCIQAGDFFEYFGQEREGLSVQADKPILVAQLFSSNTELSPSMVLVTPEEKSNSYYVFPTPRSDSRGSFVHYLQVTLPSSETPGLLLDDSLLAPTTTWNKYGDGSGFVWTSFEIPEGIHALKHKDMSRFGAAIIGHSKLPRYCSYAYPAGLCS